MKKGLTLTALAQKIENVKESKKDYVAPSDKLMATVMEEPVETEGLLDDIVEQTAKKVKEKPKPEIMLNVENGDNKPHIILPYAHRQIGDRLKIPAKYYDRMRTEAPELLTTNINHWLHAKPENRMIRTLTAPYAERPTVRAVLSNRYRRIENELIAQAILPILSEMAPKYGLEIKSCEITDTRMYIQCTFPKIEAEIKKGDIVQAGLAFRNSEVGAGSFAAEELIWRLRCENGMVGMVAMRKYHVGRRIDTDDEVNEDFYRDETIMADDKALLMKIQDTTRHAFDEAAFAKSVDSMKNAADRKIGTVKIQDSVKVLDKKCNLGLSDGEKDDVLKHLIEGGDLSQWGAANAVTKMAHEAKTFDRGYEYEKMGSRVINLNDKEWDDLMNVLRSDD
jgi:hypothetical protein